MSKRKRGEKLQYTNKNSNSLVAKVKTLKAELEDERRKSGLRLALLKRLVGGTPLDDVTLRAVVAYVANKGEGAHGFVYDMRTGEAHAMWSTDWLLTTNLSQAGWLGSLVGPVLGP